MELKIDENTQDIKELKDGQRRIENKIDITYNQVAVTAKNWQDIAKLKAIK
ncbi:hypothetical protein [Clostridium sp. M14]|uniref:hypothetical protein n=1 Tax=Clostridium sp. M14 TaxID=2716311 RepID=UPI0013EEDF07|nr:hypothetical protein [Clostridium sp. M14]MBZ9691652.1 hypothetical protein [Clostridium sp. M14]